MQVRTRSCRRERRGAKRSDAATGLRQRPAHSLTRCAVRRESPATHETAWCAVVAVGGLSGTVFREEINPADDHIASQSDGTWNRQILRLLEQGRVEEVQADLES